MGSDYKVLCQSNPSAANLTDCYTVPGSTQTVVSSVIITNRSATPTSFRLSVAVAGVADDDEQYVAYDIPIDGNDTVDYTIGMTLDATDVVRVYATDATLSFSVFGEEITGGAAAFIIGSSYLEATSPDDDNLANGPVALPWTLTTSAGTDLSINGGDTTEVLFATTGVYAIALRADIFTETANGLYAISREIRLNAAVGTLLLDNGWRTAGDVDLMGDEEMVSVLPALRMSGGDSLFFRLAVLGSDSDWGYSLAQLKIMRLG